MANVLTRLRSATSTLFGRSVPKPGSSITGAGSSMYVPALLPSAKFNYAAEAGPLHRNTTVSAALGWMQDQFGQAQLEVCTVGRNGDLVPDPNDPLAKLLAAPNPFSSAEELWDGLLLSAVCDGNSYALIENGSGGFGQPSALYYVPPGMMGPWSDPETDNLIDAYWYTPGTGGTYYLPPAQVLHVKSGTDPYDPRVGCARLKHAVRSIVTMNRAETYVAAIVLNGGPIRVFVPDGGEVDEVSAKGIRSRLERASSGENVGRIEIMSLAGRFETVGSGPGELSLGELLDRPEANICAMIGINAMVLGLAVGSAQRTFSNMAEAEKHAWQNTIVPISERFARAFQKQLLPLFPGSAGKVVRWNRSNVPAMTEDATERVNRASVAFTSKMLPRDRCLAIAGEKPVGGTEGELYFDEVA